MTRLSLPDPAGMTPADRAQYERFPANLTRALLRTNGCTPGYLALGFALRNTGLSAKQFELVILRVAALSKSTYERMQHLDPARQAGWSDIEIAAIENGTGMGLSESDAALLHFVEECVANVRVSTPTFAALRAHLSDDVIADATLLVGFYMMTARFLETLDVELDAAACEVLFVRD